MDEEIKWICWGRISVGIKLNYCLFNVMFRTLEEVCITLAPGEFTHMTSAARHTAVLTLKYIKILLFRIRLFRCVVQFGGTGWGWRYQPVWHHVPWDTTARSVGSSCNCMKGRGDIYMGHCLIHVCRHSVSGLAGVWGFVFRIIIPHCKVVMVRCMPYEIKIVYNLAVGQICRGLLL